VFEEIEEEKYDGRIDASYDEHACHIGAAAVAILNILFPTSPRAL
jgi:hypothetical protein